MYYTFTQYIDYNTYIHERSKQIYIYVETKTKTIKAKPERKNNIYIYISYIHKTCGVTIVMKKRKHQK